MIQRHIPDCRIAIGHGQMEPADLEQIILDFVNYDYDEYHKQIELCYLGSINNIIDYKIIGELVKSISNKRRVIVHIIGDGEKKSELINSIINNGGFVEYHGKIFEEKEKKDIFSKCSYALNIMKSSVNVGMTMKSLDYFSFGIPIINNINGDIGEMIDLYKIGFNINSDNIRGVANLITNYDINDYIDMRNNVRIVHDKYFSVENFNEKMNEILNMR